MTDLTPRQQQCLDYIAGYIREHGYPPSMREIMAAMGIVSPNGVMSKLRALERAGRIVVTPGVSRGIRLVGSGDFCPVCGCGKEGSI